MTPEQDENLDLLLKALRISDPRVAVLKLTEALGMCVMCIHWLRGLFHVLQHYRAFNMNEAGWNNYQLLFDSIEAYEAFIWRIAPPRAMVQAIGVFRENGFLDEEFEKLLRSDAWGRASDRPDSDEIRDVLGRTGGKDSRIKPEEEWEKYGKTG